MPMIFRTRMNISITLFGERIFLPLAEAAISVSEWGS